MTRCRFRDKLQALYDQKEKEQNDTREAIIKMQQELQKRAAEAAKAAVGQE